MSRPATLITLVLAGSLALDNPATAQAPASLPLKHTGKPTQTAITPADAMTRLYIFADDSMMGRRAGSGGDRRGTSYIEREVRRMGLVPAGDNGTFFQAVPLYDLSLDMTSKLSADSVALIVGRDYFPIRSAGMPRPVNGAQVIFAGDASDPATLIPAEKTMGKVVIISGFVGLAVSRYPNAVAFIVARPEQQLQQVRRFILGASQEMKSAQDTVRLPLTIIVPVASVTAFLGVPLVNARPGTVGRTLHGDIHYTITDTPGRNVVAILPGSDPKLRGEYVAIGGHSDHLGFRRGGPADHDSLRTYNQAAQRIYVARTGQMPSFPGAGLTAQERASIKVNVDSLRRLRPARPDSIDNGADDDGSGTVGVLEIAEKFAGAKIKPERSLLFVWHTAEESGLYGSEYFTDHPTVPRDSIVAQLNIDMIGRGEAKDIPGGGPGYLQVIGSRRLSTELGDIIEKVNTSGRHNFNLDYAYDANGHPEQYYCRSDHYEYARYGIPIVFVSSGDHSDYHQVTDEPQYIDYSHLARTASLLADVAQAVANLDHRLVVDHRKSDPQGACVQ